MANLARRRFLKAALAVVSTSLMLVNLKPGRVLGQSCGYNYYDPYNGCNPDFPCGGGGGGGGGGCFYIAPDGECYG